MQGRYAGRGQAQGRARTPPPRGPFGAQTVCEGDQAEGEYLRVRAARPIGHLPALNACSSTPCAWNAIVEHHDDQARVRSPKGAFLRKIEDPNGINPVRFELVTAA